MSGAFTHFTVVNELREPNTLEQSQIHDEVIAPLLENFKYCELGAISPDYSYLSIWPTSQKMWSDSMHYEKTGDMIYAAVKIIRSLTGLKKNKCIAWILGYIAHMVADTVIHPVVEKKVGPYDKNKTAHRICEMNQDVYIFKRLGFGDTNVCEFFDSGINKCGTKTALDPDIRSFWEEILKETYPQLHKEHGLHIDSWHNGFSLVVDKFAEEGGFPCLSRHFFDNSIGLLNREIQVYGAAYPKYKDINYDFIKNLPTPFGSDHFDNIFDIAVTNVLKIWKLVSSGIVDGDTEYSIRIKDWDLGTGFNKTTNKYVFWEER